MLFPYFTLIVFLSISAGCSNWKIFMTFYSIYSIPIASVFVCYYRLICILGLHVVFSFLFLFSIILCIFSSIIIAALLIICFFLLNIVHGSYQLVHQLSYFCFILTLKYVINKINVMIYILNNNFDQQQYSMENSFRFELSHYYRDLQQVQKNLYSNRLKQHKADRSKSFLRYKNQYINNAKSNSNIVGRTDKKSNQLSLKINTDLQLTKNIKGLSSKYFQKIQESQISEQNNKQQNSISLEQQNNNIILQIHGFDLKDDDTVVKAGHKKQRNQVKIRNQIAFSHNQKIKQQQNIIKKPMKIINSQHITQQLIQKLKKRNQIFNTVRNNCNNLSNCNNKQRDYAIVFEQMWNKYQIYKRYLNKLSKFVAKNKLETIQF